MDADSERGKSAKSGRSYKWPWLVLTAFLLGLALAILWMSFEVQRTRRNRESNPRMLRN